jgi:2-keto-4-pentenoate hydratase/2-oxohepta-3-ene-1,7-dioic acid hydratase in catechol pathway
MRIVRFQHQGTTAYGLVEGETVYALEGDPYSEFQRGAAVAPLVTVRLLAPCQPSKVVAVGLNYRDHAAETHNVLPAEPLLFLKPPTSVIGPGEAIVRPTMSQQVDHEAELAVVIARRAHKVSPAEAPSYILGYTCANDVTARDIQRLEQHNSRAKSFDTFCPLGPWIVTGLSPDDLGIQCRVNGVLRQDSRTSQLVFGVRALVSFVSQVMTLLPGDVVLTGTPAGIGPLASGDVVEVEIEGVGVLRNTVV